jgi:hypothetical protein
MDFITTYIGVNSIIFFVGSLVGTIAHVARRLARDEVDASFFEYVFVRHPGSTFSVLLTLVAATAAANVVGGLDDMKIPAVVAAGFTSGWTLDSSCDKGGKPESKDS